MEMVEITRFDLGLLSIHDPKICYTFTDWCFTEQLLDGGCKKCAHGMNIAIFKQVTFDLILKHFKNYFERKMGGRNKKWGNVLRAPVVPPLFFATVILPRNQSSNLVY